DARAQPASGDPARPARAHRRPDIPRPNGGQRGTLRGVHVDVETVLARWRATRGRLPCPQSRPRAYVPADREAWAEGVLPWGGGPRHRPGRAEPADVRVDRPARAARTHDGEGPQQLLGQLAGPDTCEVPRARRLRYGAVV